MAATIVSPSSFAQNRGDLGFTYVFAGEAIEEQITERLDVFSMGLLRAYGGFTGSGSDTIRITRYAGLGFAERMTAMSSETDPIVATGFTTDYNSLTVARYGLAKEETFSSMIFGRAQGVDLELMQSKIPESYLSTVRHLMCTSGAAMASNVGTAGSAWTYDDELELRSSFAETEGFDPSLMPVYSVRHPEQFTDLAHSLRNEPAFQGSDLLRQLLGMAREPGGAIDVLGMRSLASHDVVDDTSAWQGFAYVEGAIVVGAPSVAPLQRLQSDQVHVLLDDVGTVVSFSNEGSVATARFDVNSWVGTALLSPTLRPQFGIISVND